MSDLALQVRAARSAVDREIGEARAVGQAGLAAQRRVTELSADIELHERVLQALTRVGEEWQNKAQELIEGLVTWGLQSVFGENLAFRIVQGTRAGQATVEFLITSEYTAGDEAGPHHGAPLLVETPVMDARGGGVAAVTGFLLQLTMLLLTPGARRFLALDESFAHVSAEYKPAVAAFVRDVCALAAFQVLMVTHDPEFEEAADAAYRLVLGSDGVTKITGLAVPQIGP